MGHVGDSTCTAFFHKAQLINGEAKLSPESSAYDYAWVTKDDMPNYINSQTEQSLLSKMLGS